MSEDLDEGHKRFLTFEKEMIRPLTNAKRYGEACQKLEAFLEAESDPEVRPTVFFFLSMYAFYGLGRDASVQ